MGSFNISMLGAVKVLRTRALEARAYSILQELDNVIAAFEHRKEYSDTSYVQSQEEKRRTIEAIEKYWIDKCTHNAKVSELMLICRDVHAYIDVIAGVCRSPRSCDIVVYVHRC